MSDTATLWIVTCQAPLSMGFSRQEYWSRLPFSPPEDLSWWWLRRYSSHLFLISSASVRSLPFLSFIEPIFAWNIPLVPPIFLKRPLVFPILLLFSVSLHCWLKKAFLSLLAVLWNSAFSWVYLSSSPLPLTSLPFLSICQFSSYNYYVYLKI